MGSRIPREAMALFIVGPAQRELNQMSPLDIPLRGIEGGSERIWTFDE